MKIALDYDNCYSLDPVTWAKFIKLVKNFGHEIRGVTARNPTHGRTKHLLEFERHTKVHYTNGIAKRFYCQMFAQDFTPDVWIDDKPESILENRHYVPDENQYDELNPDSEQAPEWKAMKIALDYDNCYSLAPALWDAFTTLMVTNGHEVRVVTARCPDNDRTPALLELENKSTVHYTNGTAKRFYCQMTVKDFIPTVWVDDRPESILVNSNYNPEGLAKWRAERTDK